MKNNNLNNEIRFPLEIVSTIKEILDKYSLKTNIRETLKKMALAKSDIEARSIFESTPNSQLARIVKEIGENKIVFEELESTIQERLNISKETADKITNDFKEKIFPLIMRIKPKLSLASILFGEEFLSSLKKEKGLEHR